MIPNCISTYCTTASAFSAHFSAKETHGRSAQTNPCFRAFRESGQRLSITTFYSAARRPNSTCNTCSCHWNSQRTTGEEPRKQDIISPSWSSPSSCLAVLIQADILALQSNTYGGGSVAVVGAMAQPNAEPVEEYEYVLPQESHLFNLSLIHRLLISCSTAMRDFHRIFRYCRT